MVDPCLLIHLETLLFEGVLPESAHVMRAEVLRVCTDTLCLTEGPGSFQLVPGT